MSKMIGKSQYKIDQYVKEYNERLQKQVKPAVDYASTYNHGYDIGDIESINLTGMLQRYNKDLHADFINAGEVLNIYKSRTETKPRSKFFESPETPKIYDKLYNNGKGWFNAWNDLAKDGPSAKIQSSKTFMNKVVALNATMNPVHFSSEKLKDTPALESVMKAMDFFKESRKTGKPFMTLDSETIGGTDKYGYNQLYGMTEFSFTMRDPNTGEPIEHIGNLIGLTSDEYNEYSKKLEAIKDKIGTSQLSGDDVVFLDRWSKTGHHKTKAEIVDLPGFNRGSVWEYSSFAGDEDNLVTYENALNGLKLGRKIGEAQESAAVNGAPEYKKQLERAASIINGESSYGKTSIHGYNHRTFDLPMFNRMGMNLHPDNEQVLDFYDVRKWQSYLGGKGTLVDDRLDMAEKGLGTNTQEFLSRSLFADTMYQGKVAHVASTDEYILSGFSTKPYLIKGENGYTPGNETYFDTSYKMFEEHMDKITHGTYKGPNQQLFYLEQSNFFDKGFNNRGAMGFSIDPISKTFITQDGYEVGEVDNIFRKANVTKTSTPSKGAKKHGLYTLNIFEADADDDFKELWSKNGLGEFSGDKYFGAVWTPVGSEFEPQQVTFHTNLGHIEGILNGAVEVGTLKKNINPFNRDSLNKEGNWVANKDLTAENAGLFTVTRDASGKIKVENVIAEDSSPTKIKSEFFKQSKQRFINEPTSNSMRELTYGKYVRMKNAYNELTELESKARGNSIEAKLSYLVSRNEPMTLKLFEELGFEDWSTSSGNKVIRPGQIRNLINNQENFKSLDNLYSFVANQVQEAFPWEGSEAVPREIRQRRALAFRKGLDTAFETISKGNLNNLGNIEPVQMRASELNYIELERSSIFNEAINSRMLPNLAGDDKKYLTVKLDSGSGLLRTLKEQYGDRNIDIEGNAGYTLLTDFVDKINKTEGYKRAVSFTKEQLEEYQNGDATLFANNIVSQLSEHVAKKREKDLSFGYKEGKYYTNAVSPVEVIERMGDDFSSIANSVRSSINSIGEVNLLGYKDSELNTMADYFMNTYVMPFKKDDFMAEASNLPNIKKKVLGYNYDVTYKENKSKILDMLKGIHNSNLQLIESKSTGDLFLLGKNDELTHFSLPKFDHANGVFYSEINGNRNIIKGALDVSNVVNSSHGFSVNDISHSTTAALAAKESWSFDTAMLNAAKGGRNENNAFVSILQDWKSKLMTSSPMVNSGFNAQVSNTQFEYDYGGLITILPEIFDSPVINDLKERGLITGDVETHMKKALKDSKKDRLKGMKDLMSEQKISFVQDLLLPLTQYIGENADSPVLKDIAKNLNIHNKDTHVADSTMGVGGFVPGALANYDNVIKPTLNQSANFYYTPTKTVKNALGDQTRFGTIIRGNEIDSIMRKTKDSGSGQEYTGSVIAKGLAIDNNNLKQVIGDAMADGASDPVAKIAKELGQENNQEFVNYARERMKQVSLYEQEMLADPRFSDAVMGNMFIQKINGRKNINILHSNEEITLSNIEKAKKLDLKILSDGTIHYGAGTFVGEKDDLITVIQNEVQKPYVAKYDGLFRAAYFDKMGGIVDETTLKDKASKIISQGLSNNLDQETLLQNVQKELNKYYDWSYYVIPQNDLFGTKAFLDGVEKGATNTLKTPFGMTSTVREFAEKNTKYKRFIGTIPSAQMMEQYILPEIKKDFGEKEAEEITKAIQAERYSVGKALFGLLDPENKGISIIHSQNVAGHEHAMVPFKSSLVDLHEQNPNAFNDSLKKFFGDESKVTVGKDGFLHINNFDNSYIDLKGFNKYLEDNGVKPEEVIFGNKAFKIGNYEVSHVIDYPGGTHMGRNQKYAKKGQQLEYERNLARQKRALEDALAMPAKGDKTYDYQVNTLERDIKKTQAAMIRDRESAIASGYIDRGLKYSDRTHLILGARAWDNSLVSNFKESLNDDNLFNSIMGGYMTTKDGKQVLKDEYVGKSILEPFTSLQEQRLLTNNDDYTLKDIMSGGLFHTQDLEDKYKYLTKHFDENMSYKQAEKLYAFAAGTESVKFNELKFKDASDIEKLTKSNLGFKVVNIKDLQLGEGGGQANTLRSNTNSANFNNIIVDLGEQFKENRYVSVSRSLDRQLDEDLVTPAHIDKLKILKKHVMDIQEGNIENKEHLERKKKAALETLNEYKNAERKVVGNKNGYFGDAISFRMNESSLGKAAGVTIFKPEGYEKLSIDDKITELKKYNSDMLSRAQWEGKSILENYAEGKIVDAQWRSMSAFKDMGYFDADIMDKRLKKISQEKLDELIGPGFKYIKGDANNNTEIMTRILERHGDIALGVRFPEIMEGSDKPTMLYLDRHLQDNEVRTMGAAEMAMKADHDGDTVFAARMANDMGDSFLDWKMGTASGDDINEFVNSQRAYIAERAVVHNKFYEEKVQKALLDDADKALNSADFMKVAKDNMIDGKLYGAIVYNENLTKEQVVKSYNDSLEYMSQAAELTGERSGQKFNQAAVEIINKKYSDEKARSEAINKFALAVKFQGEGLEGTAKVLKGAVGEINTPAFKVRKLFNVLTDHGSEYYNDAKSTLDAVLYQFEEGGISAKKVTDKINPDVISNWNKALDNALSGREKQKNLAVMHDILTSRIGDALSKDAANQVATTSVMARELMQGMNNTEKTEYMASRFIGLIADMSEHKSTKSLYRTFSLGNNMDGAGARLLNNVTTAATDTSLSATMLKTTAESGLLALNEIEVGEKLTGARRDVKELIADGRDFASKSTASESGQMIKKVVQSIGEKFSTEGGKGLAMGALAIAGGFIAAGYIGGNPARPADTQAAEDADTSDFYNIPNMMDQGNIMPRNQQGYTINIDANSKHGSQKVQQILQQAINQSVPVDVNVSMNIKDSAGNITDRKIEEMINGAIG